ncbi:hypothetical protein DPM19_30975 [Actinomadura craniellae]|uniref:Uncharacterized protein n=2 Tax=Actinomadura craniellae TaxID=2231787 RepID=A0A365GX81_9ACTN|nr:hypothetical protein DPM19_30975 [Actinomadura craniellae]
MLPTVANAIMAVLWAFSAPGGWGVTAFCGVPGSRDPGCADAYSLVALLSFVPAVLAILAALLAWMLPRIRRNPDRMDTVLLAGTLAWVAAGLVLFIGGYLAQR